eukprot:COSAG05_NODE_280_length_12288_cov_4.797933_19_plen_98_part_00
MDEDAEVQRENGKELRRESLFSGVSNAANKIGQMLVAGLVAAQALAGMDTSLVQECKPAEGVVNDVSDACATLQFGSDRGSKIAWKLLDCRGRHLLH